MFLLIFSSNDVLVVYFPFSFHSSKEDPCKTLFQTPEDSYSLAGGPFSISYFPKDKKETYEQNLQNHFTKKGDIVPDKKNNSSFVRGRGANKKQT